MREQIARLTYSYVALLILLGAISFLVTGRQSVTALIPSFFGLVVLAAFMAVRRQSTMKPMIWTLISMAVVGFAATATGIPKVLTLLSGGTVARPAAVVSQSIMAVASLVYGLTFLKTSRSGPAR